MPKMKTKKALAKRVKRTGSGKLKRQHAYVSHFAANKTQKQKRKLRKGTLVSKSDYKRIKLLLND
jgi:large subunit ribosomal protein L35